MREPGPLGAALALTLPPTVAPMPSILLMPKAQRSSMGDAPCEEDGDGNGWEPVIKTDSGRGVWLPPRPREGGTPTSFVGGGVPLAVAEAISFWIMASTSSIHIRTFSGLRSIEIEKGGARKRAGVRTGVNDATTAVHVVQAEEDLLGDLAD